MPGGMVHYAVDVHKMVDLVLASKRRVYSVTTELQAVEAAEQSSKEAASC